MNTINQVARIPRILRADERGWFLKVITGTEENIPNRTGEVYLTMATPGQTRGNHYHEKANEWFTVVLGNAIVVIVDPQTGDREEFMLSAMSPETIYVPSGLAHAFTNPTDAGESMLLVAYSDELYDPGDTVPYPIA